MQKYASQAEKGKGDFKMSEIESTVNAEPEVNVEPQDNGQVNSNVETVNADNGEVTTPQQTEKPVQTAEDNAKFAAIRREAEAKAQARARDETIAEMGMVWNGQLITTYDQYVKAKAESDAYQREVQLRAMYQNQNLPDEVIDELVESKKFREESLAEKQAKAEQERKYAEYSEFLDYYRAENGKDFDPASDTIPNEVWAATKKGKTLADAYAYHMNQQLKSKIAEYEKKLGAQETNEKNASTSPGSVTGNGSTKGDFISREVFEANKHDRNWVVKNLSKISESRPKWGG